MSPTNLNNIASNINAVVGVEFEMCLKNVNSEKSDYDDEPILDSYDDNVLNEITDFFITANYNEQITVMLNDILRDYETSGEKTLNKYLISQNISTMKDLHEKYESIINWPKIRGLEVVRRSFQKLVNDKVNLYKVYHDSNRDTTAWIMEPDLSITPSEFSNDVGQEIVSPKMPLSDMLNLLPKIGKWAKDNGHYSNESCGLHINLSLPDLNMNNLNYTKLILLLGDEHILKEFGRIGNIYAYSMHQKLKRKSENIDVNSINQMKLLLDKEARNLFYKSNTEKHVSVNNKFDYIEFRAIGGDWVSTINNNPTKIINTIFRMIVALDAALDENKYKNEYITKFYKLLTTTSNLPDTDMLRDFILYATGRINVESLKSRLVNRQKMRQYNKDIETQYKSVYDNMDDILNINNQ